MYRRGAHVGHRAPAPWGMLTGPQKRMGTFSHVCHYQAKAFLSGDLGQRGLQVMSITQGRLQVAVADSHEHYSRAADKE
eukprot:1152746-Pelagomonas_calceolata.AAC.2